MQVYYSDTYELPLPDDHHFPMEKYRRVRESLQNCHFSNQLQFRLPPAATDEQLLLVHTRDYLDKIKSGNLTRIEQRRIGFPWSARMVERHRRSTGATISASRAALVDGVAVHLAGGTHHAFAERGEGFCVFNDVAVATRVLQAEGVLHRVVIIDLDVHQGNGTAAIFANDPSVFTFSMHGERNYPQHKIGSDLDVQLPDGTSDDGYLRVLENALTAKLQLESANLIFYIAGADCYKNDRYGRLNLTKSGLKQRDRLVFQACRQVSRPIAVVMGGGYSQDVQDIVDINFATVEALLQAVSPASP